MYPSFPTIVPTSRFFFFNDTATTEIYTLSLHDALPIWSVANGDGLRNHPAFKGLNLPPLGDRKSTRLNSSHITISYAVFCLKKNSNHIRRTDRGREAHHPERHDDSPHTAPDACARPTAALTASITLEDDRIIAIFFNDTATTEIYTLSLHDALPIYRRVMDPSLYVILDRSAALGRDLIDRKSTRLNSSHITISYAVFCLKKTSRADLRVGLVAQIRCPRVVEEWCAR